jgi:hypothetical protein
MTYTNRYQDTLEILGTETYQTFDFFAHDFVGVEMIKCKVIRNEGYIPSYFEYPMQDGWDLQWLMSKQVNEITDYIDTIEGIKLY